MAMTTKPPDAARKFKSTGTKTTLPAETTSAKATPAKKPSPSAAAHILQPAKGPRTISHRQIKDAVEKIFRERSRTDASP